MLNSARAADNSRHSRQTKASDIFGSRGREGRPLNQANHSYGNDMLVGEDGISWDT